MPVTPSYVDLSLGGPTIYGPCPGCGAWQLEAPDLLPLAEVEAVLAEHVRDCPPLAALVERGEAVLALHHPPVLEPARPWWLDRRRDA